MKLPPFPRTASIPRDGLDNAAQHGTSVVKQITRSLLAARSETTCKPGNTASVCAKPEDSTNTQTLPIVLGAVIPITCAIIVFYFLHRRNKKRQALEDVNDPHKSLDFGLDISHGQGPKKNKKKGAPEMIITDMSDDPMSQARKARGLSMDMLGSPYLLPAGLQGSRESLHSMSRAMPDENDPYRPVTLVRSSEDTSRSPRHFKENGSMYSASTTQTGWNDKASLTANAQRMSQSYPKRGDSRSDDNALSRQTTNTSNLSVSTSRKESLSASNNPSLPDIAEIRKETMPPYASPPQISVEEMSFPAPPEPSSEDRPPPRTSSRPPRKDSAARAPPPLDLRPMSDTSNYGDMPPPPPPKAGSTPEPDYAEYDVDPSMIYTGRFSIDTPAPSQQFPVQPNTNRMSVMGLRPLPPENLNLEESAEQRANRIRSFYKEYFDTSRPNPANGHYEEDWDPGYMGDTAMFDPETGDYFVAPQAPFAQPMGRRAMTPPPRGAGGPRFGGDHARHFSTMSGGNGQMRGRPAQRPPPKKKLPPPKPLTSLPTPHMLKNDDAIFGAADFAPPTSFREMQNGRRPDSPMGIQRPYSPSVKAYSPLVPAFDELSVMPSPHHLRKSGTFTSLDFAALPRFRGQEGNASDTGSIRSARSGISAMQIDAVRSGAYRVSRIPKEAVTTRDDLAHQLRPKMNLISPA